MEKRTKDKPNKTYTIYGIQGTHYKAKIQAKSEEQALKLADNNHEDYEWEETNYVDDWKYESK